MARVETLGVDAVVLVEPLVLDCDDAVRKVGRDLRQWDDGAVLEVELADELPVCRVDPCRLGDAERLGVVVVGKTLEVRLDLTVGDRRAKGYEHDEDHRRSQR